MLTNLNQLLGVVIYSEVVTRKVAEVLPSLRSLAELQCFLEEFPMHVSQRPDALNFDEVPHAVEFLKQLLVINPSARLTCVQALEHPFLQDD